MPTLSRTVTVVKGIGYYKLAQTWVMCLSLRSEVRDWELQENNLKVGVPKRKECWADKNKTPNNRRGLFLSAWVVPMSFAGEVASAFVARADQARDEPQSSLQHVLAGHKETNQPWDDSAQLPGGPLTSWLQANFLIWKYKCQVGKKRKNVLHSDWDCQQPLAICPGFHETHSLHPWA